MWSSQILLDEEEFDSVAAVVPITVADTVLFTETLSPFWNVFRWTQLGISSLSNPLGYPGGIPIIVKDEPSAAGIFVAYQAGSKGAGGLVYQQSDDRAVTWLGEVVIDADIDKRAAAVINPITYDIHLVYFQIGEPTLTTASNVWYRVLAWSGGVWTIGLEKQIILASATHGYSNVSLEVRAGYLMALLYDRTSTTVRNLYSAKAVGTWDLATSVNLDIEQVMTPSAVVNVDLTRDDVNDKWYITTEQGGTFTIWSPSEALRPPGEITAVNLATWYAATTVQFDTVYSPSTLTVGIVQENSGVLQFRTFNPLTNLVSAPTIIEASGAFWPCIAVDSAGRFIIAYTKTMSGNKRSLVVVRSDDWTAKYAIATDSAAEEWGGTHMARIHAGVDGLVIAWCDTADNDADTNYRVFCGVLDQQVFKNVADTILATEFIRTLHSAADVIAFTEALHASEPKSVADTIHATEALATWINAADTIHATEYSTINYHVADAILFTDVFRLNIPIADTGVVTEAVSWAAQITVGDTIAATDAVQRVAMTVAEVISADDALGAIAIALADAIAAGDALVVNINIAETAATVDKLTIGQAVAEGVAATEIINMIYRVAEMVTATEGLWINGGIIEQISATDAILQLSIHADDTVAAVEGLTKATDIRISVRLHLSKGVARLRMEGW
jgi:hypothetical protein